jgi:hypothetical protein
MEVGDRFWKLGLDFSVVGHRFQDVLTKVPSVYIWYSRVKPESTFEERPEYPEIDAQLSLFAKLMSDYFLSFLEGFSASDF